ncbi:MAG: hypothetical protein DME26_16865 [Verrucomicrobia bacterium]|nr:MAG: hypothetical protein DME26_16865 [Verrucomicrobiota bacterium]
MDRKTIATYVLLLIIAAAVGSLCVNRSRGRARINLNPYEALGAVAAEETSKLLGDHREIVMVLNDPAGERDPVLEAQLGSFTRTLKRIGKLAISATERVNMDALARMRSGGTMPPDQFAAMKAKYPRADAFVLFIGFPMLPPSEADALKAGKTKFVVISAALPGYRELLKTGVIHLAVVPKLETTNIGTAQPKSLRDWFDREYDIVTPATADRLSF